MLKGINKQIIEIKCTNDEFFEKALLFVRGDKCDLPRDILTDHLASLFGGDQPRLSPHPPAKKPPFAVMAALYVTAALLVGVLIYYGFQL